MRGSFVAVLLALLPACGSPLSPQRDQYPWMERVVAEIALVTAGDTDVAPRPEPKVGDKCPDCNDPPGACGVGRVGDGRDCRTCLRCNGDGRIDQRDIVDDLGTVGEQVQAVAEQAIVLHLSEGNRAWSTEWWASERQQFTGAGWSVSASIATDSDALPWFSVTHGERTLEFYEPLTLEMLSDEQ